MANPIELIKREMHGCATWPDVLSYAGARTPDLLSVRTKAVFRLVCHWLCQCSSRTPRKSTGGASGTRIREVENRFKLLTCAPFEVRIEVGLR
jgi:hypothetical protein